MTNNKFEKLINKVEAIAHKHMLLLSEMDKESIMRYGYYPAEVDCDELIDALQYGIASAGGLDGFERAIKDAIEKATDCTGEVKRI